MQATGLTDPVALSLGNMHSCALRADGTLTRRPPPWRGLSAVVLLGAGAGFTVALDGQAGLLAFDADEKGQFGDQLRMARALPGPVPLP